MILPQVHLQKPCYDFYFLEIEPFYADSIFEKALTPLQSTVPAHHDTIHSVVATGGVYKGQGLNLYYLINSIYSGFLFHDRFTTVNPHHDND